MAIALPFATFGRGDGPIFLDNVVCTGNESSLAECQHRGIGSHDCSHFEDAGIVCPGEKWYVCTHTHAHTLAHKHKHKHKTRIRPQLNATHTYTCTHTHTLTHTHAHTHTHTHTYTCTHTHTHKCTPYL